MMKPKDFIQAGHSYAPDEELAKIKIQTVVILACMTSLFGVVMGWVRLSQEHTFQGVVNLVFSCLSLLVLILLFRSRQAYALASRLLLAGGVIITISALFNLADSPSRFIWLPLLIVVVFLLRDRREGFYWTFSIFAIILLIPLGLHGLLPGPVHHSHLPSTDLVILLIAIFFVSIAMQRYEKFKEDNQRRMHELKKQEHFLGTLFNPDPRNSRSLT